MHYNTPILLLLFLGAISLANAAPKTNTLIVPGKSIGAITLGEDPAGIYKKLGDSAGSDSAMGGKGCEWWTLDKHEGVIGYFSLRDIEGDSAEHPGKVAVTSVYVTSPKFATAKGIAVGSTLAAIRAEFPDLQPDEGPPSDDKLWATDGGMQFLIDKKHGIGFAIRKKDGICIEIIVVPPAGSSLRSYYHWFSPELAASSPTP